MDLGVGGSSPLVHPIIEGKWVVSSIRTEHLTLNQGVAGSSPARPTILNFSFWFCINSARVAEFGRRAGLRIQWRKAVRVQIPPLAPVGLEDTRERMLLVLRSILLIFNEEGIQ
ncbi:MAG: hypothetical protein PWQ16_780 [bacterium]|nr:hypothetical protein [bacterium]